MSTQAFKITRQVRQTIRGALPHDPVAKQYLPQEAEFTILPSEHGDPIGDDLHTPVKGVVHRYPDRALLKISGVCAAYCRYCFRKDMIGPQAGILSPEEQENALAYIRSRPEIQEIILTGGDPLILSERRLGLLFDALMAMDHIQVLRIHTRLPIQDPSRITPGLCQSLKREKPVYIVLHINHEQEITGDVRSAVHDLAAAGCVLLSQSVLLKGVNDDPAVLEALFRTLVRMRIKPYYLHHPDFAPGTSHFRVSLERGQEIMKSLRGRISGLCQPSYVLDIPGGFGKMPVGPCYLEKLENGSYVIEDYKGGRHSYPPAEGS
jgi:lysine 2,3-aminomutase